MRVVCRSEDEAQAALASVKRAGLSLFEDAIRISVSRTSYNEAVLSVNFLLTAVVQLAEGGEYLLEFGKDCGFDDLSTEQTAGTDESSRLVGTFSSLGWGILPGVIEV